MFKISFKTDKQQKDAVMVNFSFLSLIFFLVLLDSFLFHPFANLAALTLLLVFSYRLGHNG